MEVEAVNGDSVEDLVKKPAPMEKSTVGSSSAESGGGGGGKRSTVGSTSAESGGGGGGGKRSINTSKTTTPLPSRLLASTTSSRKKIEGTNLPGSTTNLVRTTAPRSSLNSPPVRRNSTGGFTTKQPVTGRKPTDSAAAAATPLPGRRATPAASDPLKSGSSEIRRASLPSNLNKSVNKASVSDTKRSSAVSTVSSRGLRTSPGSDTSKQDSVRKPSVRSSTSAVSSIKRGPSLSLDTSVNSSASSSTLRKSDSKLSSPSSRSFSINSGKTAADRGSSLSGRKKASTPDSRDSRFIVLPQVEIKAGDDLRLDLRGHRVRSLNSNGLNLSSNLEFVYLRDNLLSSLEGIEILKRVKVLDLSFNEFKGPGFEPLENCKALQQLYLVGNQITSLVSLPQLPNLEFLSVAQNRLKSYSMASQP